MIVDTKLLKQIHAIAQAARLAIVLRLLEEREVNATALGDGLGIAQPTVSRHLKVLLDSGLLLRRRRGNEALFRIDDDHARRLGQQLVDLGRTLTAGGDRQENDDDGRAADPAGAAALT